MIMRKASDYLSMLQALLPRGAAWVREPDAVLTRLLAASAEELARLDSAAWRLLDETNPQTTVSALEDWERVLGLPDECGLAASTLAERRAQALRKLVRPVGQDIPFFEALAASMGYAATVEEFRPFAAEDSGADEYLNDAPGGGTVNTSSVPATFRPSEYHGWFFVFRLNVADEFPVRWFQAESSGAEDYLATWGNSVFECVINRAKPAHTLVLFGYGAKEEHFADEMLPESSEARLCRDAPGILE